MVDTNNYATSLYPDSDKVIGHYLISKQIGEGTFGKVVMATHMQTGEKVAIKSLEKNKIVTHSDAERVNRELRILKIARHPNILQLYEIIETVKYLHLVTEYIEKGELFDYIVSSGHVKERESCIFFHGLISGIEYLHEMKIAHRDLKPENLMLDFKKTIKIVDFGLSYIYQGGQLLKTACGSPCYAAPEMLEGKEYDGLKIDIWSSGIILYALVCGSLPFDDANTMQLYKKIKLGDFSMPLFISDEAKSLIRGILNTDPNKRLTIPQIKEHPWYRSCNTKEAKGIIVGKQKIEVDL